MPEETPIALSPEWARRLKILWQWKKGHRFDGFSSFRNTDSGLVVANTAPQRDLRQSPKPSILLYQFSSNAAAFEEYNGKSITGASTQDASTNLVAPPAGMTLSDTEDLLVLNIAGSGGSGHSIASGTFGAGVVVGVTTETPPRRIVWGFGGGSTSLPTPTALYQVLQVIAFVDATHYTLGWDFVRGHG
jgi:hypothetical protein